MSIQQINKETLEKSPLGVKAALQEELRVRVSEAISSKMSTTDLEEEIKDGDKVSWHDPSVGKNVTGVVTMASGMKRKGIKHAQVRIDNSHGTTTKVPHSQLKKIDEEVDQIDEISTDLKKRYVEKGAEDVVDRFTGRGKYEKPRNPENFTKTGRPKKSVLNSPAAIKYREKLANRRDIVNKVSQEVHGKKRFGEEVEHIEEALKKR